MIEKRIKVTNSSGLHMRPASDLCKKAMEFESKITISFREKEFNAKSLLSILSACVQQEDEITLSCNGRDESEAAEAIEAFLKNESA